MNKRLVSILELVALMIATNLPHSLQSETNANGGSPQSPRIPWLKSGLMTSIFPHTGARVSHSLSTSLPGLPFCNSWEIGTLSEALLEYSWPQLSVFNNQGSVPPSRAILSEQDYPVDVVNISTVWVYSTVLRWLHK